MFDRYVRVEQAAKTLEMSRSMVCKLIRDGRFPSARRASSEGFPGNPGYEITLRDLHEYMRTRDEEKSKPKTRKSKVDDETKQLLTELHTNMVRQAEIIGKLLEKL